MVETREERLRWCGNSDWRDRRRHCYLAVPFPSHPLDIAFTNPQPDQITKVSCNVQIAGHGTAPAGQVIVVSNQEQGTGDNIDPNVYFAKANVGSSGWSVDEQLGNSTTAEGTPYRVTVWLVDNKWTDYLTNLTNLPGGTTSQNAWWSSHGLPLDRSYVRPAHQEVVVQRS